MAGWPVAGWPGGRVAGWPHGRVAGWPGGRVAGWPGGRVAGWPDGRMAGWPGGRVAGWPGGRAHKKSIVGLESTGCFPGINSSEAIKRLRAMSLPSVFFPGEKVQWW